MSVFPISTSQTRHVITYTLLEIRTHLFMLKCTFAFIFVSTHMLTWIFFFFFYGFLDGTKFLYTGGRANVFVMYFCMFVYLYINTRMVDVAWQIGDNAFMSVRCLCIILPVYIQGTWRLFKLYNGYADDV